jgi:hypothetical protein
VAEPLPRPTIPSASLAKSGRASKERCSFLWSGMRLTASASCYHFAKMNERRSFPLISELPKLLDASDWKWQKPPQRHSGMGMSPEWWIGADRGGRKWLVKMRNGFYAYREHVFASLAQRLRISCLSSAYLLIGSEKHLREAMARRRQLGDTRAASRRRRRIPVGLRVSPTHSFRSRLSRLSHGRLCTMKHHAVSGMSVGITKRPRRR